ncbi:ligand-binding sensor domain-containing protein [Chitinophaga niabensis]|uniref:histidine kinase n=1 Tax=Chitinophaga niabensis TaxID=536979 RepID=A0A1N6D7Q6_9BACT|nr:sensor histidine kinase [Chitinophaga niabensis]SIN66684.1 ligand-binding sensor domain-containing protein [Chitinophaga niabensis]
MQKRFICTLIILFLLAESSAQPIYFRHYEVENGLSNNSVITSLQDKDGFMWFGTGDGLNRFNGYNFKIFRIGEDKSNNPIFHLYQDAVGTLWVATLKGLFYFNSETGAFTKLEHTKGQLVRVIHGDAHNNIWFVEGTVLYRYHIKTKHIDAYQSPALQNITTLYKSSDGTLWLGCANGVLARYDAAHNDFVYYTSDKVVRTANTIETICEDKENGSLLIGTSQTGLLKFSMRDQQWKSIVLSPAKSASLFVRSLLKVNDTDYWIGTESGLYILNSRSNSIQHICKVPHDQYSLTDNAIYSICKDKEGGIWIGTFFGGINYYAHHAIAFEKFFPTSASNSIEGNVVREMVQDKYGKIWVGSEDKGIAAFDPEERSFVNYSSPGNIHGLLADNDHLYIGTFKDGLYVLDLKTNRIVRHYAAYTNNGLNSNYINILYKTAAGAIIVCTSNGVYNFDRTSGQFYHIQGLVREEFYSAITQDSKGRIWLGTHSNGIYYIDASQKARKLSVRVNGYYPFDNNKILNFLEDGDDHLWICTESGLFRMNLSNYAVEVYNTQSGMPSNIVYCTVQDDRSNIWASTSMGLAYIDLKTGQIKTFKQSDGLLSDQFNHRSSFKDKEGNIYFGCLKGLVRFNPRDLTTVDYTPPIYLTQLEVFNKDATVNSRHLFYDYPFLHEDNIRLPYNNSTFSLDFVALSFTAPDNIRYAYMLDGIDENWNFTDKNKVIHFNNLSPGNYTIKVRSTNSSGIWASNETSFKINITPPFWKTGVAYFIYTLAIIAIVYFATKYYSNRYKEKQLRMMEIFTLNKEKELYQAKIDFFTKVAHEIKTPLTLIKMPMSKILKNVESIPGMKHEVMVMNKNTDRLLTLTNQLLDFRMVESGNYFLHLNARNIVPVIEEVHSSFQPAINKKKHAWDLVIKDPVLICNIDEDGVMKIVSNLIDNAIKYCHSRITLTVQSSGEHAVLRITNDGDIIPEEERAYIFEPFYRSGNTMTAGTGIGLSLAKSIALLHNSSLEYSVEGGLNTFTLVMPLYKEDF